jgi:hypothetical protein
VHNNVNKISNNNNNIINCICIDNGRNVDANNLDFENKSMKRGGCMKAYEVFGWDGHGTIVFADTPGKAKANAVIDNTEFIELHAKRAKYADPYVEQGFVPKKVMLENGWWFNCNCYQPQHEDTAIVIDEVVYCKKCKPEGTVAS